ncbi:lysozyme inhibitor LprI family protein [Pandoraea horticolens]|nr:lysozyme inhibitor LprI family protein [Pandoraea horticolens]
MSVVVSLLAPLASHAASFDCTKAASATEKAICADAKLSKLDSDLAVVWKRVSRASSTPSLVASQLQWLKRRDTCGADVACLSTRYNERLAALADNPDTSANRWTQTWHLDSNYPGVGGTLTFTGQLPRLHFEIAGYNGGHAGGYDGDVVVQGEGASYQANGCGLNFKRSSDHVIVTQGGDPMACGQAMGVDHSGTYITTSRLADKPEADLLSLKALDNSRQNVAAHDLLRNDYQALVDTINMSEGGSPDLDHLGAKVDSFFVRGLAPTNASIVMRRDEELWIGLLAFDANGRTHMRYYTNVAAWKTMVPKTIQRWHDTIDTAMPIDWMP